MTIIITFREELQLNEYASRLGELLMLLQVYEVTDDPEFFKIWMCKN